MNCKLCSQNFTLALDIGFNMTYNHDLDFKEDHDPEHEHKCQMTLICVPCYIKTPFPKLVELIQAPTGVTELEIRHEYKLKQTNCPRIFYAYRYSSYTVNCYESVLIALRAHYDMFVANKHNDIPKINTVNKVIRSIASSVISNFIRTRTR